MRPPETEGTAGKEDPRESPDVEIGAWASAGEVAFHQVPEVRTTFGGGGESAVEGSRENPPQGGEPGTSHRRVHAHYRAVSRVDPRQAPPDEEESTPDR